MKYTKKLLKLIETTITILIVLLFFQTTFVASEPQTPSTDVVCDVNSNSVEIWIDCDGKIIAKSAKSSQMDLYGVYGNYVIWIARPSQDKWAYYFNTVNGSIQTAKKLTEDHSHFEIDGVYDDYFLYYAEDEISSNIIQYAYYINEMGNTQKPERALTATYTKRNFIDINTFLPERSIRDFYVINDNKIVWLGYDLQRNGFAYYANNFTGDVDSIRRLSDIYLFDFTSDNQPTSLDIRDAQIVGNTIMWKARYGSVQHSKPPYSIEYLSQTKVWQYFANDIDGNENTIRALTAPFATTGSILDDDLPSDMTYFKIAGDKIIYRQFYCKEGDIACISKEWAYYSNNLNGNINTIRRLTRYEISEFSFIRGNYLLWKGKRYDHTVNSGYQVAYYVNTLDGNLNTIRRITQESPIEGIKGLVMDGNIATWKYSTYIGVNLKTAYYSNSITGDTTTIVKISNEVSNENHIYGFNLDKNSCSATWTECTPAGAGTSCLQKSKALSNNVTAYFGCSNQNVYWFNFCGGVEDIKEPCSGSLESNAQCVNNELTLNDDFTIYSCVVDKCVEQKVSRDSYQARLCGSKTKCSANLAECTQCIPGDISSKNCFDRASDSGIHTILRGIKHRLCNQNGVWESWPESCSY